jgi:hypothetical protein
LISVKAAQAPYGFAARNVETSEEAMLTWED